MKSVKRTAAKALLVLCACALIIFLLLPFLETTAPADAKNGKKATPQIFTSNPLTTLVNRIAALFGSERAKARLASAKRLTDEQAAGQFGAVQEEAAYSARHDGPDNFLGTEPSAGQRYNYGDAAMRNEEGDWVLVRQTLPSGASKGMHEVNADEDAYNRYIRQERTAKFTPSRTKHKREVPDSKLAKFFRPIKEFFGFTDDTAAKPVSGGLNTVEGEGTVIASSSGLGGGSRSGGSGFAGGMALDAGSASGIGSPDSASEPVSMADLFAPEGNIDNLLETLDKQTQNELSRDERRLLLKQGKERAEAIISQARNQLKEKWLEDAQGKEPEPLLEQTLINGCRGDVGPLYARGGLKEDVCGASSQKDAVQKAKEKAKEQLNKNTGLPLPELRMVVVLGKTSGLNPPAPLEEQINPEMRKIYELLLKEQGCDKNECFWVSNNITAASSNPDMSTHDELRNTIESSGVNYLGDPLYRYQTLSGKIITKAVMEESDELLNIQKSLGKNAPFYVPYTKKDWDELTQRNSMENIMKKPKEAFLTYIPTAANAAPMLDDLPYPGFVIYDQDGSILDLNTKMTEIERGAKIRDLIEERVLQAKEVGNNIQHEMAKLGVDAIMKKRAEKFARELQQKNKEFSQSNQLGNAKRGQ